jgi:hypothetical protein
MRQVGEESCAFLVANGDTNVLVLQFGNEAAALPFFVMPSRRSAARNLASAVGVFLSKEDAACGWEVHLRPPADRHSPALWPSLLVLPIARRVL